MFGLLKHSYIFCLKNFDFLLQFVGIFLLIEK